MVTVWRAFGIAEGASCAGILILLFVWALVSGHRARKNAASEGCMRFLAEADGEEQKAHREALYRYAAEHTEDLSSRAGDFDAAVRFYDRWGTAYARRLLPRQVFLTDAGEGIARLHAVCRPFIEAVRSGSIPAEEGGICRTRPQYGRMFEKMALAAEKKLRARERREQKKLERARRRAEQAARKQLKKEQKEKAPEEKTDKA